ncbi:MAG: methyltransferase domain-containing protein [Halioglobus sp.]|nr:methyltransferase domain-containing protein [Halioglobus sp.]
MTETVKNKDLSTDRDSEYRRLEREWQNDVGQHLLDAPHEAIGSSKVFADQFMRIINRIDLTLPGPVVEIGCGKGHFLAQLAETVRARGIEKKIIGIDISRAVEALPGKGLAGICADGQELPMKDNSLSALVYDGALHHLIDYPAALREASRVLKPGGQLILFEPVSSVFTRTVHRILDPFIFQEVEYESPIDQNYKDNFREDVVLSTLSDIGITFTTSRSDFLAYPLTGCYAGSSFGHWPKFMKFMLSVEKLFESVPVLRSIASFLSWRFLLVAEKPMNEDEGVNGDL